jgi:hypothetical protein
MDKATELRIEALEGKVLAAHAAIRALIACHPNPEHAIAEVSDHLDRFAGLALAGPHPDAMADALSKAWHSVLPTDEEIDAARTRR